MAEAKKIKDEELEAVRLAVSNFNRGKSTLGDLEYQKSQLISEVQKLETALKAEQTKLENIYGSITVNLDSGEYEESVEEAQEVVE
jgi:hypothetical protein